MNLQTNEEANVILKVICISQIMILDDKYYYKMEKRLNIKIKKGKKMTIIKTSKRLRIVGFLRLMLLLLKILLEGGMVQLMI